MVARELTEVGVPAEHVVAELARDVEPYVAAHVSGRYFGFVIGGLHPAAYGAELLVSTWDQNAALFGPMAGASSVEEVAAGWLIELLGLPAGSSLGSVTGGQMANFTCLAAARDHVLREVGWDVEADGLPGAPRINVVLKTGKHTTVTRALRYLGLGERTAVEVEVASDDEDRFVLDELRTTQAGLEGPTSVRASYLIQGDGQVRDPFEWTRDFSRRARGVGVDATLRSLGCAGVADLVDRTCRMAQCFATELQGSGRATVVNDVAFNQVLVHWHAPDGHDRDEVNDAVVVAIQTDGTAYVSPTTWRGERLMRLSVSDWATDDADVDRAVVAMLRCHDQVCAS